MSKPIAPQGTLCPLFRKDVSKVCHKCHLYGAVRVVKIENSEPVTSDHWDCSFNHARIIGRDVGQAVHEMAAATESARNVQAQSTAVFAETHAALVSDLRDAFAGVARAVSAVTGYVAGSARAPISDLSRKD